MFKNDRYMTKGVNEQVPFALQIWIWNAIDTLKTQQIDYLQVFEIKVKNSKGNIVEVVHRQEEPDYCKSYELVMEDIGEGMTIFVIDDRTHSTMLLSEEY
ncbi:MAG: DUF960 family protein [Fusobacteriaceae bacterium]